MIRINPLPIRRLFVSIAIRKPKRNCQPRTERHLLDNHVKHGIEQWRRVWTLIMVKFRLVLANGMPLSNVMPNMEEDEEDSTMLQCPTKHTYNYICIHMHAHTIERNNDASRLFKEQSFEFLPTDQTRPRGEYGCDQDQHSYICFWMFQYRWCLPCGFRYFPLRVQFWPIDMPPMLGSISWVKNDMRNEATERGWTTFLR